MEAAHGATQGIHHGALDLVNHPGAQVFVFKAAGEGT
jgi:hypothetical protein